MRCMINFAHRLTQTSLKSILALSFFASIAPHALACTPSSYAHKTQISPEGETPVQYRWYESFTYEYFWGTDYKDYLGNESCIAVVNIDEDQDVLSATSPRGTNGKRMNLTIVEKLSNSCPPEIKGPLWRSVRYLPPSETGCGAFYQKQEIMGQLRETYPDDFPMKMQEYFHQQDKMYLENFIRYNSGRPCVMFMSADGNDQDEAMLSCETNASANAVPLEKEMTAPMHHMPSRERLPFGEEEATALLIQKIRDHRASEASEP